CPFGSSRAALDNAHTAVLDGSPTQHIKIEKAYRMNDLILLGWNPLNGMVPVSGWRDIAVRVQWQSPGVIRKQSVLRQNLIPMAHRYGPRIHTGSTKNTLGEESISDLGKLVRGIPRRIGSHIAIPKVPRHLPELVNRAL